MATAAAGARAVEARRARGRHAAPRPDARVRLATAGGAVRARVVAGARAVRWYVRELTGEAAYDRYVAAHTRTHPDHPPLTRAQWWRARDDVREQASHERCC